MNVQRRSTSRAASYRSLLGTLRGTFKYFETKWSPTPVAIQLPGAPDTLLVRPRTSDRRTFHKIFLDHEYGFGMSGSPELIIDAGANVGYASVYFARRFPGARIVAIEPDQTNFALLERNTRSYPTVKALRQGVWTHPAQLVIENPDDASWAFRVREAGADEDGFAATSIGEILETSGRDHIDLLKLDVEGTEYELFASPEADAWLSRTHTLVAELHEGIKPGTEALFEAAMRRHRFEVSRLGENYVAVRASH
jgi:FkbM family methyltransferase